MAATSTVHVRVDEEVKARATQALNAMGLSVADAIRLFLGRVAAERRLPFALEQPQSAAGKPGTPAGRR